MSEQFTIRATWKAEINGKRALNGKRFGITCEGTVEELPRSVSVYSVAKAVLEHLRQENPEMEITDSVQITVALPVHYQLPHSQL